MDENELKKAFQEHLGKTEDVVKSLLSTAKADAVVLKDKSIHTNWLYALIGIFLLFLIIFMFVKSHYDQEALIQKGDSQREVIAAAEKASAADEKAKKIEEAARQKENQAIANQIIESNNRVAIQLSKQNELIRKDKERDIKTDTHITEITKPGQSPEQVAKYSVENYGINPVILNGGLLFKPDDVQTFVAVKVDRDRLQEKVKSLDAQLESEKKNTATQTEALNRCAKAIEQSNIAIAENRKTIDDKNAIIAQQDEAIKTYRKAAVKSGWQKTWDVAKNVGFIGLGIAIGSLLH